MKKLYMLKAKKYKHVALQNHITVKEVKKEIKLAMLVGMCNQDPVVKKIWNKISHDG